MALTVLGCVICAVARMPRETVHAIGGGGGKDGNRIFRAVQYIPPTYKVALRFSGGNKCHVLRFINSVRWGGGQLGSR